jgi:hypothetical protein
MNIEEATKRGWTMPLIEELIEKVCSIFSCWKKEGKERLADFGLERIDTNVYFDNFRNITLVIDKDLKTFSLYSGPTARIENEILTYRNNVFLFGTTKLDKEIMEMALWLAERLDRGEKIR